MMATKNKSKLKIALSAGHNVYIKEWFDNGTSGHGRREAEFVKETVAIAIRLLRAKGHEVLDVTPYNRRFSSHYAAHDKRAEKVKQFNPDLYLDFHLNAGGGTGPETIVYSTTSPAYPWAKKITDSIAKETGLTNKRGVKIRPELMSVNMQPQPSIIVEGAFMDTRKDMDSITPKLYAEAVADVFEDLMLKESDSMSEDEIREIVREELSKAGNNESVGSWAKDGIDYVKKQEIMTGYEDGTFKPNRPVTRAELATAIYRMNK